jgi:hypothetical protein
MLERFPGTNLIRRFFLLEAKLDEWFGLLPSAEV